MKNIFNDAVMAGKNHSFKKQGNGTFDGVPVSFQIFINRYKVEVVEIKSRDIFPKEIVSAAVSGQFDAEGHRILEFSTDQASVMGTKDVLEAVEKCFKTAFLPLQFVKLNPFKLNGTYEANCNLLKKYNLL